MISGRETGQIAMTKRLLEWLRGNRMAVAGWTAGLLLLSAVAWNVFIPHADQRINAISKQGYPVTLAELDAWYKPVPPLENAALTYLEAFAHPLFRESPGASNWIADDSFWSKRGQKMDQEAKARFLALLATNQPTLKLLHSVTNSACSRYPIDLNQGWATLLPHLSKLKRAVQLLGGVALAHAAEGNLDGAVDSLIAAGRAADSLQHEPSIISQLVRMACWQIVVSAIERIASGSTLNEKQIERLEIVLHDAERPECLKRGFGGEQAFGVALFTDSRVQMQAFSQNTSPGNTERLRVALLISVLKATGLFAQDKAVFLDLMATNLGAANLPFPSRLEAGQQAATLSRTLPGRFHVFSRMMLPAVANIFYREADFTARLRVARAALRIERFRRTHGNALPQNLEELTSQSAKPLPCDPYDGKPLRFKKLATGYVIYSIGKDGVDDGGLEHQSKNSKSSQDITFVLER